MKTKNLIKYKNISYILFLTFSILILIGIILVFIKLNSYIEYKNLHNVYILESNSNLGVNSFDNFIDNWNLFIKNLNHNEKVKYIDYFSSTYNLVSLEVNELKNSGEWSLLTKEEQLNFENKIMLFSDLKQLKFIEAANIYFNFGISFLVIGSFFFVVNIFVFYKINKNLKNKKSKKVTKKSVSSKTIKSKKEKKSNKKS